MTRWIAFGLIVIITVGCNSNSDEETSDNKPDWNGELTLEIRDWEGIQARIDEEKGYVVVVDVWTSWTVEDDPDAFADFVALQHDYPERVRCIGLNIEYSGYDDDFDEKVEPSYIEPRVREFLEKQGADFPNLICSVPDEEFLESVEEINAAPTVLVYNKDGELAKVFNDSSNDGDGFTYGEDVEPFVKQLLNKK